MKESIAVITTLIIKGSWKVMIMDRMKPKNITRRYSKGILEKPRKFETKKVRIINILRKKQTNTRNKKWMTNRRLTDRKETQCSLSHVNSLRISPMMSLGIPSSTISSPIVIEPV